MAEICSTRQDALPGLGSRFEESLAKPGAVESMIEKYTATGGKLDSGFELATDTVGNYDLAGISLRPYWATSTGTTPRSR